MTKFKTLAGLWLGLAIFAVALFAFAPLAAAADGVFNICKGRGIELYNRVESNDPTNSALIVIVTEANEADATLEDYDDINALFVAAGNTEATSTGYARKTLTDTELVAFPAPDDTNNRYEVDAPDQTWTGVTGADFTKVIIAYDNDTGAGTDANLIPCAHFDFAVTTDGSDVTLQFDALGWFRAS